MEITYVNHKLFTTDAPVGDHTLCNSNTASEAEFVSTQIQVHNDVVVSNEVRKRCGTFVIEEVSANVIPVEFTYVNK
jgi:hypothetical protein